MYIDVSLFPLVGGELIFPYTGMYVFSLFSVLRCMPFPHRTCTRRRLVRCVSLFRFVCRSVAAHTLHALCFDSTTENHTVKRAHPNVRVLSDYELTLSV